jgi:hypothetical protein
MYARLWMFVLCRKNMKTWKRMKARKNSL